MCYVFFRYLPALIPLFLACILMAQLEDWSVIDAMYYCVVTTTTIGKIQFDKDQEGLFMI